MSVLNVPTTSTVTPRWKRDISMESDSAQRSSAPLLAEYDAGRGHAHDRARRRHDDDSAVLRDSHRRKQVLREADRSEEIGGEHVFDRRQPASLPRTRRLRRRHCGRCRPAPDSVQDLRRGAIDRCGVVEVELDSDQTLLIERRTQRVGHPFHSDLGCAHRRQNRPAASDEMHRGRQTQATRRAGNNDAPRPIGESTPPGSSLVPQGSECDGAWRVIVDTFLTAPDGRALTKEVPRVVRERLPTRSRSATSWISSSPRSTRRTGASISRSRSSSSSSAATARA